MDDVLDNKRLERKQHFENKYLTHGYRHDENKDRHSIALQHNYKVDLTRHLV